MGPNSRRLAVLIGQFPARNHGYLLEEIRLLRERGVRLSVASVSFADRRLEELSVEERGEAEATFYLKRQPLGKVMGAVAATFLSRPAASGRGLWWALKVAGRGGARRRAAFYFAEAVLVGRWMRQIGASHLHTHFSSSVGLIAKMIYPISVSFTAHGFSEFYDPSAFQLREKIAHSLFVRAISQHGRSQLMLAAAPESWSKLLYCPLGVNCSKLPQAAARQRGAGDIFEIACVGRLAPEKGQPFLLHALAELREAGRRAHVHFYGDGPDRSRLEALARSLRVADGVTFHGWTDTNQLRTEYERMDCVVVPSLYEGIPIVLMEAMALGIPCIAPHIGGIPELVRDMATGLLFAPGDPHEMAQAVSRLMESPELQISLARRAREYVLARYDIVRNTDELANLLSQQLPELSESAPYAAKL